MNDRGSDDSEPVPVTSENFELWIRMATDNKINTDNSWNFALIDYFYDFSVLRDGDGINFQKASTTLDGCMKIYSHRVDSAAKDTGTLLSTLNIRPNKSSKSTHNEDENGKEDEDEEGEEEADDDDNEKDPWVNGSSGNRKKKSKIRNRSSSEKHIANSFNIIKIKDSNRPVKIDPVFKNALADFDEGGAKSLLNNILRISKEGKVVFDVANDDPELLEESNEGEKFQPNVNYEDHKVNDDSLFSSLKKFVTFDIIGENLDICPSLTKLNELSEGKGDASSLLEELDQVDITAIENEMMESRLQHIQINATTNNNDNQEEMIFDNDDLPVFEYDLTHNKNNDDNDDNDDNATNNDGEDDAMTNFSKRTQYSLYMDDDGNSDHSNSSNTLQRLFDETFDADPLSNYENLIDLTLDQLDLKKMNIFNDIGSRSNVFWKIARLKRSINSAPRYSEELNTFELESNSEAKKKKRKYEKNQSTCAIDFLSDENDLEEVEVFKTTEYISKIFLNEKERKANKHLLENDSAFTVKNLAFLSLKPKQITKSFLVSKGEKITHKDQDKMNHVPTSENFFAENYKGESNNDILNDSILSEPLEPSSEVNNFDDFDPNGIEGFDMPLSQVDNYESSLQNQSQPQSQTSQNLHRSATITYAKRSKKVDVKLLKQNIWKSIEEITIHKKKRPASHFGNEEQEESSTALNSNIEDVFSNQEEIADDDANIDSMNFTQVVEIMSSKYDPKVKRDLSTSFCFICLLHLANEQGLTLETKDDHQDIIIHK
jgi:condensin complex subunit 2